MYNSSSHSSGMHGAHSSSRYSSGSTAACPTGSTRSEGVCVTSGTSYSSGSSHTTFTANPGVNVQPFTTSVSNISDYRIAGMGSNESLAPTTCPTSVYNPGGAKVLGCYSVVKPAPVMRPAPVVVPQMHYQHVRVVRPIIYVRYPVPTPVAVPVYHQQYQQHYRSGGCGTSYSRYGNNWPRMGGGCGG